MQQKIYFHEFWEFLKLLTFCQQTKISKKSDVYFNLADLWQNIQDGVTSFYVEF